MVLVAYCLEDDFFIINSDEQFEICELNSLEINDTIYKFFTITFLTLEYNNDSFYFIKKGLAPSLKCPGFEAAPRFLSAIHFWYTLLNLPKQALIP